MKIVKPYAKILTNDYMEDCIKKIEYAARISHRSEDDMKEGSSERFLTAVVLNHGDWSVVEHVSVSVEMLVDRGITHEIVRHRIASYTQESTRFVNYVKKMPPSFIYPIPDIECFYCLEGDSEPRLENDNVCLHYCENTSEHNGTTCLYDPFWVKSILESEKSYKELLAKGWRPQEARSVFPNALASKILVTMNLRSWRHFLLMRTTKEAHPQMRQITIPLLKEFQTLIPVLYNDIIPESRQVENISKGR
jgi:thymidylate synthase (FAD)